MSAKVDRAIINLLRTENEIMLSNMMIAESFAADLTFVYKAADVYEI